MSKIKFKNGPTVNFNGNPTPQDIEEVSKKLGLSAKQTTISETPEVPAPGLIEQFGTFVGKELAGAPQKTGLLGGLVQSTIGSKGVLGVAQMPGRVAAQPMVFGSMETLGGALQNLSKSTADAMKVRRTITDPVKLEKYNKLIAENTTQIDNLQKQLDEASGKVLGPKEALATTARAELTLAPYGKIGKAATAATGIGKLTGLTGVAARVGLQGGISGITGAIWGAAQAFGENKAPKEILKTSATTGLSSAVIGASMQLGAEAVQQLGRALQVTGEKIQMNVIKPSKSDYADGFDIKNVEKYKLGGTLKDTLKKSSDKLTELNGELKQVLSSSDATLNTNELIEKTALEVESQMQTGKYFGKSQSVQKVLQELPNEIDAMTNRKWGGVQQPMPPPGQVLDLGKAGGQEVDLLTANTIKRSAGRAGAWLYGKMDPDATAKELVYTTFYRITRKAIEDAAQTPEVALINSQMGDIIPIQHAIIRRIPVASRSAPLGLIESIELVGSLFDKRTLGLVLTQLAMKSGQIGTAATKLGGVLEKAKFPSATLPSVLGGEAVRQGMEQPTQ